MQQANGDDSAINKRFGEAVKRARIDADLTQAQLAEKLGSALGKVVNTPTINRLEKGTRPTPLNEVYALADVLGVDVDTLLPTQSMVQRLLGLTESSQRSLKHQIDELEEELREKRQFHDRVSDWVTALRYLQHFNNGGVMRRDQVEDVLDNMLLLAQIYGDWQDHLLFLEPFGIPYDAAGELLELIEKNWGPDADLDASMGESREKILKVLTKLFLEYNKDQIVDDSS